MADKSIFIDTGKCTACRGCQVACKQWHRNPGTKTTQRGSHQNPADFSFVTYKLVRFSEVEVDGDPKWYFFPDQCRHCMEPPCLIQGDALGCKNITRDEATGAILYNPKVKTKEADFKAIREACPYDIPRRNEKTGAMAKCSMCVDRVKEGMLPACVKSCPTGAMNFGDRKAILEMAHKRLEMMKGRYENAQLTNPDDVRVIYLLLDDPKRYHRFAVAENTTGAPIRTALKRIFGPRMDLNQRVG